MSSLCRVPEPWISSLPGGVPLIDQLGVDRQRGRAVPPPRLVGNGSHCDSKNARRVGNAGERIGANPYIKWWAED